MAYSKTTWNNLSDPPINADNLNKIEQGIYDNSLGIDKINPSGTATTTAEIEEGQITDVIGFKSLKLKGQTSQYTTTGQNILPQDKYIATQTINGITYTNNGDGTFNLTGTATANTTIVIVPVGNIELEANQAYYLYSSVPYNSTTFNLTVAMSVDGANKYILANNTHTPTATPTNIRFQFYIGSGQSINQTNIKAMLVKGSTAPTTYEKYTGGKASPNPDFPQDVNNVSGDNVVGISNKNINSSTLEVGNISNGANTTDTNVVRSKDYIMVTPSTAYTFSINGTANKVVVSMYDENKVFLTNDGANGYASSNGKFTTYSNAKYIRYRSYSADKSLFESGNIQLEKGTSATSFVAHQGNNFDIDLPVENLWGGFVTDVPRTIEGITYTNYEDGSIKAIGTATANSYSLNNSIASSNNHYITLPAGTYTLSGATKDCHLQIYTLDNTRISYTTNTTFEDTFTLSNSTTCFVRVEVISTRTVNEIVYPQIEKRTKANKYTPYRVNPIELCKIGTYQDYIYKKDGKWYKHKAVQKIKLDGSETYVLDAELTTVNRFRLNITSYKINSIASTNSGLCNQLKIANAYSQDDEHLYSYNTGSYTWLYLFYNKTRCADISGLQTWLSANNLIIYGILNTPIDEEITYAPLLRQLDEIYNSGLYNETNISQDNSSEAFILDMEACKNNINGIVEYIRR